MAEISPADGKGRGGMGKGNVLHVMFLNERNQVLDQCNPVIGRGWDCFSMAGNKRIKAREDGNEVTFDLQFIAICLRMPAENDIRKHIMKGKTVMVKHIILWNIKDEYSPEEKCKIKHMPL